MSDSLFDFDPLPDQYAVMGNPIDHSKSPRIHSEFARQTKQHIEYHALQVDEGGLKQAVGNFQANGGKGLNITVPFKEDAWRLVDERSTHAEQAGAVNTIMIRKDGSLFGDNTDGIGLMRDIKHNHQVKIKQLRVLIMGAGGAVRGILAPLLEQKPATITIVNRTLGKAVQLADLFTHSTTEKQLISACAYDALDGKEFDLIINGTSASLQGDLPPLPDNILAEGACCYDMMYGKEPTPFLRWAAQQGASLCFDGLGMLVEQAAVSFELWRGVKPNTSPVITLLQES